MINQLLAHLRRPERGWDPVPEAWADAYANGEWSKFDPALIDRIEARIGPVAGLRVLDLGGGPGQFSAEFARRGADVVWHDISARYRRIAEERIRALGLRVRFSIGYLEEAEQFIGTPFDLVFNRICWRYCQRDRSFADLVYRLVAPGGAGYIDSHHADLAVQGGWSAAAIRYRLNATLGIKIGHPPPPPGRITSLIGRNAVSSLSTEWSTDQNERVLFIKVQ